MEAEPAPLTFEQFVDGDFKRLVMPRFKPSTREGYEQLLHGREHGLVALLGHKRLDAIGIADVRVVEAGALARKARPRYAIVCLHTVLRCAAELGILQHMPRLPKLPARSKKLPSAPPLAVVEQLLLGSRGMAARCGGAGSPRRPSLRGGQGARNRRRGPRRAPADRTPGVLGRGAGRSQGPRRADGAAGGTPGRHLGAGDGGEAGDRASGGQLARSRRSRRTASEAPGAHCKRGSASSRAGTTTSSGTSSRPPCQAAARTSRRSGGCSATRTSLPRRVTCMRRDATWWPRSRYCRETAGKRLDRPRP